ncbi:MAG: hypothetical protein BJBARM5_0107 [Candidatus Parvarchaeum acidophilus ARMAN-5]|jgi:membrane-associated HD superfamily phosphohydrolase|uniref:Uncharacterized protein n=1 Tax=Candidatus Parvarchaeum acidophilus ARMAN-5 TaxID=662762 RepID=D6GUH0_PARA5|nr:MAG: hypothetical protein BJBARM5_0107 [Candidatus Parvarchaeum acidophilus ARMAN-5]
MVTAVVGSLYSQIDNALKLITPPNVSNPIEFWLAFLLILAILSTVLKNVDYFKDNKNKGARGLIALIIAYFAVTVAWVSPILVYMSSTLAVTALILVAMLMIASLLKFDITGSNSKWLFIVAIGILFLGGGIFSNALVPSSSGVGSELSNIASSLIGPNLAYLILGVIIIFVIAFTFGGGSNKNT